MRRDWASCPGARGRRGDDATCAQLHVEMAETYAGMCRLEQSLGHPDTAIELATRAGATAVQAVALG